jgi:ABC-type polysaccharide/polyol phosphate transport system ATPase subunit
MQLEVERVWKRYRLGGPAGVIQTLRGRRRKELWAVKDVSLQLQPGESVGLIGHNGAGKTTVLKLIAGITRPTHGSIRTRGRVASLVNLGAGFHRELTGRENVLLNAVILGLTRAEAEQRYDAIVEFAGLESFMDTPVKQYSSGMYARLGFAVAAHTDPDLLLVDEVLSVGDVSFQDRSIRKMLSFRDSGQAILFVSHNLSAVEMMCQRTIWLDHGVIRMHGPTAEVVRAYLDAVDEALTEQEPHGLDVDEPLRAEAVLLNRDGEPAEAFTYGDALRVLVRSVARARVDGECQVTVRGDYGPLFSASTSIENWTEGHYELECAFDAVPLLPGLYRVDVAMPGWTLPRSLAAFRITNDLSDFGSDSVVGTTKSRGGFLAVAYEWRLESTDGSHVLPGLRVPNIMAR